MGAAISIGILADVSESDRDFADDLRATVGRAELCLFWASRAALRRRSGLDVES